MTNELSIFGLQKADLFPIISSACSQSVTDFSLRSERAKKSSKGICGEYTIPTFTVHIEGSEPIELEMFVRRQKEPATGSRQAHHYQYFRCCGVPTANLYGVHLDNQGREVLFLELLDEVSFPEKDFLKQSDKAEQFLKAMAKLNCTKLTTDYAAEVGRDMARREGYTRNWNTWLPWSIHILNRIEQGVATGSLDHRFKQFCFHNPDGFDSLNSIALKLMQTLPSFPIGLVHGDLVPHNTGWRKETHELVLLDFEDVMFDVRFYDIAHVLGGPEPRLEGTSSNEDLLLIYLMNYSAQMDIKLARVSGL